MGEESSKMKNDYLATKKALSNLSFLANVFANKFLASNQQIFALQSTFALLPSITIINR